MVHQCANLALQGAVNNLLEPEQMCTGECPSPIRALTSQKNSLVKSIRLVRSAPLQSVRLIRKYQITMELVMFLFGVHSCPDQL